MRQLLQVQRNGELLLREVPTPKPAENQLLIRTAASLVSVGTEKHLLEFAQKSLLGKALERPDLVLQVLAKARTDGLAEAWRQAMARLDTPAPVGYSSAGVVIDRGSAVENFALRDRVACSGSGFAAHSEIAAVPANLCVKLPESVGFDSAAFAALGGIALEAVRMSHAGLGSQVAVIGLGLLGQLAVQLLRAAGCHVVGMDPEARKAEMALQNGAEAVATSYAELRQLVPRFRGYAGFDSVILLAATASTEPLEEAAEICRERGRVVATGLVGLQVPRKPFYDKELELVVSRAWGPGLYDAAYTSGGRDYPLPYVRWTAQRNVEEFVAQLAKGTVHVEHLISHRYDFERCTEAYELILSGREPYLGILLTYLAAEAKPQASLAARRDVPRLLLPARTPQTVGIGLIGAGLFARGTLLPTLQRLPGIRLRGVASSNGLNASYVAEKFGFGYCASDYLDLLLDPEIHLVLVATRNGSHASIVCDALRCGKHVFVEKPLATNRDQLEEILRGYSEAADRVPLLMVGFNRRFSPCGRWLKQQFEAVHEPLAIQCNVNAGQVAPDSWVYDPVDGGGRIIGEVCHFIDLLHYLGGCLTQRAYAESIRADRYHRTDNLAISLSMNNGGVGSILYASGGDKAYPRERVEVFGGGTAGQIDDFRSARFMARGRARRLRHWLGADRGHRGELEALLDAIRRGEPGPVALDDYIRTTLATFALEKSLRTGAPVDLEHAAGPFESLRAQGATGD